MIYIIVVPEYKLHIDFECMSSNSMPITAKLFVGFVNAFVLVQGQKYRAHTEK